ncbi:hypothetical protein E2562_031846 [Oryza meyeriana var. granulata]|uniref:Uncharacterized protein n=1 Tax=Oryza meyeriana var. granulata TaxID=110450 RepID=A0A6G1C226_9ORYZ|nr:hypothetical protein E2562_031846 [Oryza meyeriana var. granulata]
MGGDGGRQQPRPRNLALIPRCHTLQSSDWARKNVELTRGWQRNEGAVRLAAPTPWRGTE